MGIGPVFAVPRLLEAPRPEGRRHRSVGAERGLRQPVPLLPRHARHRSGEVQRQRRLDRHRPSLRHDRRAADRPRAAWKASAARPSTPSSRCASAAAWARPDCSKSTEDSRSARSGVIPLRARLRTMLLLTVAAQADLPAIAAADLTKRAAEASARGASHRHRCRPRRQDHDDQRADDLSGNSELHFARRTATAQILGISVACTSPISMSDLPVLASYENVSHARRVSQGNKAGRKCGARVFAFILL